MATSGLPATSSRRAAVRWAERSVRIESEYPLPRSLVVVRRSWPSPLGRADVGCSSRTRVSADTQSSSSEPAPSPSSSAATTTGAQRAQQHPRLVHCNRYLIWNPWDSLTKLNANRFSYEVRARGHSLAWFDVQAYVGRRSPEPAPSILALERRCSFHTNLFLSPRCDGPFVADWRMSESNPWSNCVGVGGQPRICKSTGITEETPPTQA